MQIANSSILDIRPTAQPSVITPLSEQLKPESEKAIQNTPLNDTQVTLSQKAHALLATEQMELRKQVELNNSNVLNAEQKMQYLHNLDLFVEYAQRYSQQDNVAPMIENRAGISAYSLIADKVVPTVATNELQE